MKYRLSIQTIVIGTLLTFSIGCKKEETEYEKVYSSTFSRKALAYVKLTEGKYLIYKDSATQLLDSVIVTTSKLEFIFFPKTSGGLIGSFPPHQEQNFSLVLSKSDSNGESIWFSGYASTPNIYLQNSIDTFQLDLHEPDYTTVFSLTNSDNPQYSVVIEGKNYNNVVVTASSNGLEINDPAYKSAIYYWAKDIGIIKRTVNVVGTIKTYTLLRNN